MTVKREAVSIRKSYDSSSIAEVRTVNAIPQSRNQKLLIWPAVGIALGALAGTNSIYEPRITLEVGVAAWFADLVIALLLSTHPVAARLGVLVAGLFMAIPCFLWTQPLFRSVLMCCMFIPFALITFPLLAPSVVGFRAQLAYLSGWLGTREVKRRRHSFDTAALFQFVAATVVLGAAMVAVKAISGSKLLLPLRSFSGGIMILAFAEIVTASHNLLTALMGLQAPALMQSPYLSTSITEFWTKRWNPAASVLFRKYFFDPLARRGAALALLAAFFASAVGHALLCYMAAGRWKISLACGAFFLVQPLLIAAERWMQVKRWRPAAGRAWTLAALAITSPLFVEPALQIIEPSWGTPNEVLLPITVALGFAITMNIFFSLASLAARTVAVIEPEASV